MRPIATDHVRIRQVLDRNGDLFFQVLSPDGSSLFCDKTLAPAQPRSWTFIRHVADVPNGDPSAISAAIQAGPVIRVDKHGRWWVSQSVDFDPNLCHVYPCGGGFVYRQSGFRSYVEGPLDDLAESQAWVEEMDRDIPIWSWPGNSGNSFGCGWPRLHLPSTLPVFRQPK